MKFNIPSKLLLAHLSTVSKVVSSKNTISILDNFLFTLSDDSLSITGSDQETTLTTTIPVMEAEGTGRFAVNVKSILDLAKEMPDQPLTFEIDDERFDIKVTYQNGEFNFVGINGEEFPQKEPTNETIKNFNIPASAVRKGLENTMFATGTNELNRIMMGVLWDITPDMITFVASDAQKLVRYQNKNVSAGLEASFVMPPKPTSILNSILTKCEGGINVAIDSKSATFELPNYSLTCRFINGKYPNYNSVIPQSNPYKMTIDRVSLLNAIRRVSVFISGGLVKFNIKGNTILLKTEDVDYSAKAEETVNCDYEGEDMVIGFHNARMIEVLNNMNCETIIIQLSDPSRAGVFLPMEQAENEDLLILLMPITI